MYNRDVPKPMRLLMVVNKPEREVNVLTQVSRELQCMLKNFKGVMLRYSDPQFMEKALAFEPTES